MSDLPDPSEVLPHREPFLFIDEIVELVPGESARARWTLDPATPFLAGHFPGEPIMPGVIIIEALAQTGALAALSLAENAGKLALFTGIEKARFRRPVRPGETLDMTTRVTRRRGPIGEADAVAMVGDEVACQATLRFAIVDRATATST
ncbi:MAG: beta-hydroxyacyl-ACP dehydratase [Thermoleophilia bacterium]|nr:beta-hydroxyacyl-ACP dehydratase [Thermoleophilia bacterium]